MFFIGFFQQRKPRRVAEGRISRLNIVIFICQVAAFAFACIDLQPKLTDTIASGYGASVMSFNPIWNDINAFCDDKATNPLNDVSISNDGYGYTFTVEKRYSHVIWARLLGALLTALTFNACVLLLSLINKIWYEIGHQTIRIRSITIHQNVTVTAQLICVVFSVVSLVEVDKCAAVVMKYVRQCGPNDYAQEDTIAKAMPSIPLIAALAIDAMFQFVFYVMYGFYGSHRCHLDYTVVGFTEDGTELDKKVHNSGWLLNNDEPLRRDRAHAEELAKSLREGRGLAASVAHVPSSLSRGSQLRHLRAETRVRSEHHYRGTPPLFVAAAAIRDDEHQQRQGTLQQRVNAPSQIYGSSTAASAGDINPQGSATGYANNTGNSNTPGGGATAGQPMSPTGPNASWARRGNLQGQSNVQAAPGTPMMNVSQMPLLNFPGSVSSWGPQSGVVSQPYPSSGMGINGNTHNTNISEFGTGRGSAIVFDAMRPDAQAQIVRDERGGVGERMTSPDAFNASVSNRGHPHTNNRFTTTYSIGANGMGGVGGDTSRERQTNMPMRRDRTARRVGNTMGTATGFY